jgi:uncharacterized SAM-binding protein YcdF (DUF218 family)
MFFILSKIAYTFIHPFTWLLVALLYYIFGKRLRVKRILRIAIPIWALFFTNSFVFKEFVRLWEYPTPQLEEQFEIAVVLGGMFEYDASSDRLSARRGADRIWQGLNLYHEGTVKKVLISGDHGYVTDRGLHEAQQIGEDIMSWGFPEQYLLLENVSRNTYENAVESVKMIRQTHPHVERILLITSSTHMRRAKACFEKQGIEVVGFPTDQYTGGQRHYNWDEFIVPNADNFGYWFTLIKEWVGYFTYWMMGYL